MGPEIYKVERIGSGFLAIMAKPVAGEWIDDEFSGIAEQDIKQVVSLLEPHEIYDLGLIEEKNLCKKYGMEFYHYPIPDRGIPNSVVDYAIITKNLYYEMAGGKNTVIHCRAGIGRIGIVAAGVLIHCAFEPYEAFQHLSKSRGMTVPDTEEQRDWVISNYEAIVQNT